MSIEFYWLLCSLNQDDEAILAPLFESATQKATLSVECESILQQWRNDPGNFLNSEDINESMRLYNGFVWSFIFESFQELGEKILSPDGKNGFRLNGNNCLDLIRINCCSPGAVLWHALGPELAERMAGYRGNIFLSKNSVSAALDTVLATYDTLGSHRANPKVADLYQDCIAGEKANKALLALSEGLQIAKAQGHGFMALGMCAEEIRWWYK